MNFLERKREGDPPTRLLKLIKAKMMVQLNATVKDCLSLLQSLQTAKEQLSQTNQRSAKRLCERAEIFLSALISWEDPDEAYEKEAHFFCLKELLSEIIDFVSQYEHDSSFSIARKMAVNEEFRSKRSKEFSSLNSRIHNLTSILLPSDVSVEKLREEDLEDFQLEMDAMLEAVVEDVSALRTNSTQLKVYLQALREDCSIGQEDIANKLSDLEKKLAANQKISLADLGAIEQVVHNGVSGFMDSLKSEFNAFKAMLHDTQTTIASLKESSDAANVKLLEEMERKFASFQAISLKEIHVLKTKVGDANQALMQKLEDQFASLNLLSMQRDIEDVKTLLQELKESHPASDARVKTWLQQLEDKVNTSAIITKDELLQLQTYFAANHGDVMHLLGAKIVALNQDHAQEAQKQCEAEHQLRIVIETRLKAEEKKNIELQNIVNDLENRALSENISLRNSLESLWKEEHAKLEKALEEANAQQRFLEEELERGTIKFEAMRSYVETLEKENKRLQDALVAVEVHKNEDTRTKMNTLPGTITLPPINLL
jgi:hypothetical protein